MIQSKSAYWHIRLRKLTVMMTLSLRAETCPVTHRRCRVKDKRIAPIVSEVFKWTSKRTNYQETIVN